MSIWQVLFLSASEEINKRPEKYWTLVMDVARRNNLKRIVRCSQIMGRAESDDLSAAQIFYPCMQCADIFFLEVRLWRPCRFISGKERHINSPTISRICLPYCSQVFRGASDAHCSKAGQLYS